MMRADRPVSIRRCGVGRAATCLVVLLAGAGAAAWDGPLQRAVSGKVGTPAPAFTAQLLTGEWLDSKSLLGKVVVLKFWYVACGPCRQEIPELNKLVDQFAGQSVVFLGLALDSPQKLRAFLEETPYRYQVVADAAPIIEAFGGATYYPTHVVIDRRGTIVHRATGGSLHTQDVLRPIITAALGGSSIRSDHRLQQPEGSCA